MKRNTRLGACVTVVCVVSADVHIMNQSTGLCSLNSLEGERREDRMTMEGKEEEELKEGGHVTVGNVT
jgi:hypothetical protein